MAKDIAKAYEPSEIEQRIYGFWMEKGYFRAEDESRKPPYCIVLPPPNITGALHMGHALTATIQDMLVRWRRMQGMNALWLPGADHAGIATQMVVERALEREGASRHDVGREAFIRRVWQWRKEYGGRISEQHQRLGASLDWARERFTLDEASSRAVTEAFVRLHEQGLVYRDNRLINWCPSCRSAISDLEVDREEPESGEMWRFAYPLSSGQGEIVVATTRPETMLGDTAIAVHPDDPRYKHLVGRTVRHPILGREIPIIGDPILADPEKGTGAVKVTPAHDPNDFECGKRHGLAFINILNPDATLNDNAGPFAGLDRFEARKRVKARLVELELARGEDKHTYAPGRCYRHPGTIVEPLMSLQWFVDAKTLAGPVIEAVRQGRTEFVPREWEKTLFHWLENIQDWCVSRQLWWGHRIPAWMCDDCEAVTVARTVPSACSGCGGSRIRQDEDVLDTWFSSALWPFSTLGWPEQTRALATFYPNAVMETGYDIIFFWVARMMMMGLRLTGDVPFRKVLIHAMVRDERGKKMSKATGNVIDPIDVIDGIPQDGLLAKLRTYNLTEKELKRAENATKQQFPEGIPRCGCDSLRFTLAAYTAQGRDIKLSLDRVMGYRRFGNKIWQVVRGVLLPQLEGFEPGAGRPDPVHLYDRWLLSRLSDVIRKVNAGLEAFEVDNATSAIYQFLWHELCDWYVELRKAALRGEQGEAEREAARRTLHHGLETSLRLLHPFMPFITEELWQALPRRPGDPESIMIASYPGGREGIEDAQAETDMARIMEIVTAIRTIRSEYGVPPSASIEAFAFRADDALKTLLDANGGEIRSLIRAASFQVSKASPEARPRGSATAVAAGAELAVPLQGVVDAAREKARLEKELGKIEKDLVRLRAKLSNSGFLEKASADVVERERGLLSETETRYDGLHRAIERLRELEER